MKRNQLLFCGDFAPRNPASRPFAGADANVIFCLNLPPKPALNHKVNQDITLAYDQNSPKTLQNY
ncbi:hypothetical protein BZP36_26855 [Raoultella terrigena]|nr:hypothetical protein BZP36_26855 [Raoultella terrigena]